MEDDIATDTPDREGGAKRPSNAPISSMTTFALTAVALTAFAGNSLLCRTALRPRLLDAATFTTIRLTSGALVLWLLAARAPSGRRGGSWGSAVALFVYAAAFSFAYLRIAAGTGALLLFGAVQVTMIGWGLVRGEHPSRAEWIGCAIAAAGLLALTLPGAEAPDPIGAALMAVAGLAWGVYSLRGRGAENPLATNADNFARSVPFALLASALTFSSRHATARGALLAAASGALASGVGYSVWYAAMRGLSAVRAAIVQLAVPVLAAAGGVALLGESVSARLAGAGAAIAAGVCIAVWGRR